MKERTTPGVLFPDDGGPLVRGCAHLGDVLIVLSGHDIGFIMAGNDYMVAERLCELILRLHDGIAVNWEYIRDEFQISDSCAHSYMAFLRQFLGPQLEKERNGKRVRYRLRDRTAPTEADITRAASVKFGEIALDVLQGTKYHRLAKSVAGAERSRVLFELVDDLDRLAHGLHRRTQGPSDYRHKARELEVWLDGIRLRRQVSMQYQRADGKLGEYIVDPFVLVLYQDRLHLLSYHPVLGQHRTFNLDGVLSATLLEQPFRLPADFDPRQVYRHSFGIWSDIDPEAVTLHLRGVARIRTEQRPFHVSQCAGPEFDEGWREFRYTIAVCPEFRSFLLGLLPDVRVVEPRHLVEHMLGILEGGLAVQRTGS